MMRGVKHLFADLRGTRKLAVSNDLGLLAGSLSFYCLFSVLPFLILCFMGARFLLERFAHTDHSALEMQTVLQSMFPYSGEWFTQSLISVLRSNAVDGFLGFGLLIYSTYKLFACLHSIFKKISINQRVRHPFLEQLISSFCFLVVSSGSTAAIFLFSTKSAVLKTMVGPNFAIYSLWYINSIASLTSALFLLGSLTFLYKMLPTQKIGVRNALRGGSLFLGSFVICKAMYQFYIVYFHYMNASTYGRFFKPLLFLAWIHFLVYSFLFAAQYVIYLESKDGPKVPKF